MRSNSAWIQRRAAPMPRVSDSVSDRVWRVPNDTSLRRAASTLAADGAVAMACSAGLLAGGTCAVAAGAAMANAMEVARVRRMRVSMCPGSLDRLAPGQQQQRTGQAGQGRSHEDRDLGGREVAGQRERLAGDEQ